MKWENGLCLTNNTDYRQASWLNCYHSHEVSVVFPETLLFSERLLMNQRTQLAVQSHLSLLVCRTEATGCKTAETVCIITAHPKSNISVHRMLQPGF